MMACPTGYEHDHWLAITIKKDIPATSSLINIDGDIVIGSTYCTVPTMAVDIISYIFITALSLCFVLLLLRINQELVLGRNKNKMILAISILAVTSIPFLIAILVLRNKIDPAINLSLIGCAIIQVYLSILLTVINLTRSIPEVFAIQVAKGQVDIFSKDKMIKGNIIVNNIFLLFIFVFYVILVPATYLSSTTNANFLEYVYYRVGSFSIAVIGMTCMIIVWKSCSIILDIISQVQQSSSSNPTTAQGKQKLEIVRKKFLGSKTWAFSGIGPFTIWALQGIAVPFYWYLFFFHLTEITLYFYAIIGLYPLKIRIWEKYGAGWVGSIIQKFFFCCAISESVTLSSSTVVVADTTHNPIRSEGKVVSALASGSDYGEISNGV